MMRRPSIIATGVVVVLLTASLRLAGNHDVRPAIVTPQMDAHRDVSGALDARWYRLTHGTGEGGDRSSRPRLIALTFDDGPYPVYTPLLLDELRDLRVPATFFLIGRDAEQWPELTARIRAQGNEIADHTYSHPNLDQETDAQVAGEIVRGRDVLWHLAPDGAERSLMRPPHGRYNEATLRVAQRLGYDVVLWTYDSGDWKTLTSQAIGDEVTGHATAPDIVLMHNGKVATVESLPGIVRRFRSAGYQFVTVGDLLRRSTTAELNHPARPAV